MPKVVFWHRLSRDAADLIIGWAPPGYTVVDGPGALPEDEKIAMARDADFIMMVPATPVTEPMLQACTRLRLVQIIGAGFERLDLPLLSRYRVPVANTPNANAPSVAEHAVALLLAVYKRLLDRDRMVRQGRWPREAPAYRDSFDLLGKTVGYVGLGHMGKALAQRLRGFQVRQLYTKRTRLSPEEERLLEVEYAPLEELLRQADVVTLHVNVTPETRGMIGARELALMKPTAVLINTARGAVVDQAALVEALRGRRIAGAGLDVFEEEPLAPAHPLTALDNVVLTPHSAGNTWDLWPRFARAAYDNLERVWRGVPPLNLLNP